MGGLEAGHGERDAITLYEAVGGDGFFVGLVDRFYDRVETDELLRPLYPDDLGPSRRHTALFLMQYWGGPSTYSEERGHPRLRMRHAPFAIGVAERDAWFGHMELVVRRLVRERAEPDLAEPVEQALLAYFDHASTAMINQPS